MSGSKKIKNHITSKNTRNITPEFLKKYGVTVGTVISALYGDTKAVKEISEIGHDGRKILTNADLVKQNLDDAIQGTNKLNQILADSYVQVGKGSLEIEKNQSKTWLEDKYLVNGRKEESLKYVNALELEEQTHQSTIDLLTEQGVINKSIAQTESDFRAESQRFKLTEKQIKANQERIDNQNRHQLTYGRDAIPHQLPHKEYETVTSVHTVVNKIKAFFLGL